MPALPLVKLLTPLFMPAGSLVRPILLFSFLSLCASLSLSVLLNSYSFSSTSVWLSILSYIIFPLFLVFYGQKHTHYVYKLKAGHSNLFLVLAIIPIILYLLADLNPFFAVFSNQNIAAFVSISAFYIYLSTAYPFFAFYSSLSKIIANKNSALPLILFLLVSFFVFKSRISIWFLFVFLLLSYPKGNLRVVILKYGFPIFLCIYFFLFPLITGISTYLRFAKLNLDDNLDTYSDDFRSTLAPSYVYHSISVSSGKLLFGHGFSVAPSISEYVDQDRSYDRLHNYFLTVLFQMGVVGLFSTVVFYSLSLISLTPTISVYASAYLFFVLTSASFLPATLMGLQSISIATLFALRMSTSYR